MNTRARSGLDTATLALIALGLAAAWALLHAPLADPQTPKTALFWAATLGLAGLAIAGIRRLAQLRHLAQRLANFL